MGDVLKFLAAWVRNPAKVGAIAPSSRYLAAAMVRDLRVCPEETVVEFGPGTGPFTAALAQVAPRPECYLGIERDPGFVRILRSRFPELNIVEGSAENAVDYVRTAGRGRVKAVVCGLPFASLPPTVQDGVIRALDTMLGPGSEFRTFQYVHAYVLPTAIRFRKRMAGLFGPCTREAVVFRNLPPAFVLRWRR